MGIDELVRSCRLVPTRRPLRWPLSSQASETRLLMMSDGVVMCNELMLFAIPIPLLRRAKPPARSGSRQPTIKKIICVFIYTLFLKLNNFFLPLK